MLEKERVYVACALRLDVGHQRIADGLSDTEHKALVTSHGSQLTGQLALAVVGQLR